MAIVTAVEQGYSGQLVSLGGVRGLPYQGRKMEMFSTVTITATLTILVLSANSKRIAAVILNTGSNPVTLNFSSTTAFTGYSFDLAPNESFWINSDFPWTGEVRCYSALGSTVRGAEVSVQ